MSCALFILLGYLSGSVLWAYYLPLWMRGIDVTADTPDGNPGVFNCVMKAGKPIGMLALLCDLAKGALPVFWAARALDVDHWSFALVLLAPVAGHVFSILRGFRGGKGIAVSFGVLLGLLPMWEPVALLAASYLFFTLIFRVDPHRRRSIVTFLCFGAGTVVWLGATAVTLGCILVALLVAFRHRRPEPEEGRLSVCLMGGLVGRKRE